MVGEGGWEDGEVGAALRRTGLDGEELVVALVVMMGWIWISAI